MVHPTDSLVTTMLADPGRGVLGLDAHHRRLSAHGVRLRLHVPDRDAFVREVMTSLDQIDRIHLLRWSIDRSGTIEITPRPFGPSSNDGIGISVLAPKWSRRIRGTKHGAWAPYLEARDAARTQGADVAFLCEDGAILDADRGTPVLLDQDGVIWTPDPEHGSVESITLELIRPHVESRGFIFRTGRLVESMIHHARELLVVGTGLGILPIAEIDDQDVGEGSRLLLDVARVALEEVMDTAWCKA